MNFLKYFFVTLITVITFSSSALCAEFDEIDLEGYQEAADACLAQQETCYDICDALLAAGVIDNISGPGNYSWTDCFNGCTCLAEECLVGAAIEFLPEDQRGDTTTPSCDEPEDEPLSE